MFGSEAASRSPAFSPFFLLAPGSCLLSGDGRLRSLRTALSEAPAHPHSHACTKVPPRLFLISTTTTPPLLFRFARRCRARCLSHPPSLRFSRSRLPTQRQEVEGGSSQPRHPRRSSGSHRRGAERAQLRPRPLAPIPGLHPRFLHLFVDALVPFGGGGGGPGRRGEQVGGEGWVLGGGRGGRAQHPSPAIGWGGQGEGGRGRNARGCTQKKKNNKKK